MSWRTCSVVRLRLSMGLSPLKMSKCFCRIRLVLRSSITYCQGNALIAQSLNRIWSVPVKLECFRLSFQLLLGMFGLGRMQVWNLSRMKLIDM